MQARVTSLFIPACSSNMSDYSWEPLGPSCIQPICPRNQAQGMQSTPLTKNVPAGATDRELVARAMVRDEIAVRAILQANNRRLFRIARGILRNDSEAEDVVQETYVRALT